MHHDFIDRYSRIASPVHRLPAGIKIATACGLVFLVVLSPGSWIALYVAVAILLMVVVLISAIPVGFLVKRILFFEPFVLVIAALALFQPGGIMRFGMLVIKSTLSLLTVLLLSNTTPFSKILDVSRRLRLPSIMITILALMYRYLFVLIDEMERIRRARRSRTFVRWKTGNWFILATVVGQLFVRSTDRAERIYSAMCARGWKSS
jgi:cobalt/nickel transport system permease protein